MEIGKRIRLLRKEKKLTLAEVSKETGIAQSTLSRIEKGNRIGNFKTHLKICEALGISISELYKGIEEKAPEEVSYLQSESRDATGFRYNEKALAISLTRDIFKKKMMPALLVIGPSNKAEEPGDPSGTEKFLFCYEGALEVKINKKTYVLKKGNTLYFNSSIPHSFKNTGKTTAKCLSVSSPVRL